MTQIDVGMAAADLQVGWRYEPAFPGALESETKAMVLLGDRLIVLARITLPNVFCKKQRHESRHADLRTDSALAALFCHGASDPSFGDAGFVMSPFGSRTHVLPVGLISTRDGKVLVLGDDRSKLDGAPVVARYTADGVLDRDFGREGIVSLRFDDCQAGDEPFGMIELHDGSVLVAVTRFDGNANSVGMLVRLRPNGQLDTEFHDGGRFILRPVDEPEVWFEGVMQQSDGKPVVWGSTSGAGLILRLGHDDLPDAGFGEHGVVHLARRDGSPNCDVELYDIDEGPGGDLIVVGASERMPFAAIMAKLNAAGQLAPNFNEGEIQEIKVFEEGSRWLRGFVKASGAIVAAGVVGVPFDRCGEKTQFLVGRYHADGSPDAQFGKHGLRTSNLAGGADIPQCALLWGEQQLLVGGVSGAPDRNCCVVAYKV